MEHLECCGATSGCSGVPLALPNSRGSFHLLQRVPGPELAEFPRARARMAEVSRASWHLAWVELRGAVQGAGDGMEPPEGPELWF